MPPWTNRNQIVCIRQTARMMTVATGVQHHVDHIVPLCAGGPDGPENMQWQAVEEAKAKDLEERRVCHQKPH